MEVPSLIVLVDWSHQTVGSHFLSTQTGMNSGPDSQVYSCSSNDKGLSPRGKMESQAAGGKFQDPQSTLPGSLGHSGGRCPVGALLTPPPESHFRPVVVKRPLGTPSLVKSSGVGHVCVRGRWSWKPMALCVRVWPQSSPLPRSQHSGWQGVGAGRRSDPHLFPAWAWPPTLQTAQAA